MNQNIALYRNPSTHQAKSLNPTNRVLEQERMVTLQPIAIRIPNEHCIYSLSKLCTRKQMGYEEFFSEYIDQSRKVRVCFEESIRAADMLQKSVVVKAYGFSYDGWYIISSEGNEWRSPE